VYEPGVYLDIMEGDEHGWFNESMTAENLEQGRASQKRASHGRGAPLEEGY
jgi:hypothetical protein